MDNLMQARAVNASYGQRRVLKGVDLSIDHGEIVGLIGVNGAGKSTLVDVFTGGHPVDSGSVTLAEERFAPDSPEAAQAAGVGFIEQNFVLPGDLTVAKALFRRTFRADEEHEALRERAVELLAQAEAELDPDAMVSTLDRGEQALLEVTRMLAEEAQLVIMDEVAVTLADHEIAVLHHVLRTLAGQGRGILYITHRLDELLSIVSRVVVMREGVVAAAREVTGTTQSELIGLLLEEEVAELTRDAVELADDAAVAIRLKKASVKDAFSDVDLDVRRGEILAVSGTTHSGVRELVEVLGGARHLDSGEMLVDGKAHDYEGVGEAEVDGIGYLPDEVPGQAGGRLVESTGMGSDGLHQEIRRARRMIELVDKLRINTKDINAEVKTLSGGDRQKAELLARLEGNRDILILNHPTRGIDVGARTRLFELLRQITEAGGSVVMLTSDMSEVMQWADRALVMREGKVIFDGLHRDLNEDVLVSSMLGKDIYSGSARRSSGGARRAR